MLLIDMMAPCWPFPGPQQQLRAFASAFGHHHQRIPGPYLDARGCPLPPLPCAAEWRLAAAANLNAKSQAEQWALHAAAAVAAELPRRFPNQHTAPGKTNDILLLHIKHIQLFITYKNSVCSSNRN